MCRGGKCSWFPRGSNTSPTPKGRSSSFSSSRAGCSTPGTRAVNGPLRMMCGFEMPERRRNLVVRPDGRVIDVARPRGQLFVCATGCCCGRTTEGFPAVPTELYHNEWERRQLRNIVHLTIGGCLGPCALANVVLLLF